MRRNWVLDNDLDWDSVAEQWIQFFDDMEDELFHTDDQGIDWTKIGGPGDEAGGVSGFGK